MRAVHRYLAGLARLGIEGPVHVGLSLLGVSGYKMATSRFRPSAARPFGSDALTLGDVVAENTGLDRAAVERLMRPPLDRTWNAGGYPRSPSFGADGAWLEDPW